MIVKSPVHNAPTSMVMYPTQGLRLSTFLCSQTERENGRERKAEAEAEKQSKNKIEEWLREKEVCREKRREGNVRLWEEDEVQKTDCILTFSMVIRQVRKPP